MSKIEELIERLCPEGVEFRRLGEVCTTLIPKIKIKAHDYLESGQYPIIDQGQEFIGGYTNEEGVFPNGKYVLFGDHTCNVKYVDFPFAQGADGLKVIVAHENSLIPKFLYYCMCNIHIQADYARHWGKMKENEIPLPPLAVQEEIVRILDAFTSLEAELEAELEARKKQYAYYRDTLLSFDRDDPDVEWKRLGEVGTFTRGKRFVKADIIDEGVPCIHYGDLYTYYGLSAIKTKGYLNAQLARKMRFAHKNDVVIVGAGENNMDIGIGLAWLGEEDAAVHDACYIYRSKLNPKYLSHYLRSSDYHNQIKKYAYEGKICSISAESLAKAVIAIPPLPVQHRIAETLDKFEALTSDLQSGLPAEIDARRKQYEYYRDRLLTFKRKEA